MRWGGDQRHLAELLRFCMSVIDMFFVITEKVVVDILQSEKELPPSISSDMGDPREQ